MELILEPGINLKEMILVFGSNLSGYHGGGAARYAFKERGAEWGVGEGFTGSCYALPTVGERLVSMDYDEMVHHIDKFLYASVAVPHIKFQVTRVGTGLGARGRAEFTDANVARLFEKASRNC